jgi:hypothetical protein
MELGFFETNVNGREVIGHLGDTEAFHTSLHLFMKDGIGFYVSFNSGGRQGASGDLRNALFMDFADRYLPYAGPADGRVDAATAKEHAKMMAGSWDASRRWQTNYFSVVNLLGQFKVATNDKGELVIPGLKGRTAARANGSKSRPSSGATSSAMIAWPPRWWTARSSAGRWTSFPRSKCSIACPPAGRPRGSCRRSTPALAYSC